MVGAWITRVLYSFLKMHTSSMRRVSIRQEFQRRDGASSSNCSEAAPHLLLGCSIASNTSLLMTLWVSMNSVSRSLTSRPEFRTFFLLSRKTR